MSDLNASDARSTETRTATLAIGRYRMTGPAAVVVLLAIVVLIVAILAYVAPPAEAWPLWISGLLWIAFIVYWSAAAASAGATKSAESGASRRVHTRMLNGAFLLLFLPLPLLGRRFLPVSSLVVPAGLTLQTAFFLLALWARRHLGRNWSGAVSTKIGHQLVRSGPYRIVRHPIYTAMLGMFAGAAVVSGQLHALLAVLLVSVAYGRKIPLEERVLRDEFGPAYDDYARDSWALVPFLY